MLLAMAIAFQYMAFSSLWAKEYAVFDVVGDSVSAGVNPDYYVPYNRYGWVHILFGQGGGSFPAPVAETINSLWPGIVQNNSAVIGSKASDWAASASAYMTTVLNHHPDLVVVMIGGNDFIAFGADGQITAAEIAAYRANLETILDRLQAATPRPEILVVGYYDLADGYSANLPALLASYRGLSPAAIQGNEVIRQVAEQKGAHWISIYDAFFHHAYGESLGDAAHQLPEYFRIPIASFDIHPITVGHRVIYSLVYQKLLELKNTRASAGSCWMLY